jgi:protein involved in polysaccharide export with SLBB domain
LIYLCLPRARGKTPTQVREAINQALIDGEFYNNPTVNVSFVNKTVDYSHRVSVSESIFIRALETDGRVSFSGSFPIDSEGKIHIPMVGDLTVQGQNFSIIETTIKNRLISGQFLNSPTVHVAGSAI